MPRDVQSFLREAEERIEQFTRDNRIASFVASDFRHAYALLRALAASDLSPGEHFCEWGSGFGVVACLAAMLGYEATGIEIEDRLIDESRRLADDFGLEVDFVHDSFVPAGADGLLASDHLWYTAGQSTGALRPDDFDIIFVYPWPNEEDVAAELFDAYGGDGAILMSHHGLGDIRLRQKTVAPATA